MESKARLIDISKDWKSGKFRLTFEVDSFLPNMVDAIKDVCLRLSVKKWKEKRSLDANGYMWVLLSKLSEKLNEQGTGTDPQKLYEHYLRYYGVLAKDEDGHISITIRSRIDIDNVPGHWRLYKKSPDLKWNSYLMIKGTSEYDTAEMAHFIDHIVEDCKEQGIETETPKELERLWASIGIA